jgi:hypothetical protein
VQANVLIQHPVEFLFIDGEDPEVWYPWLCRADLASYPHTFIWMGPSDLLGQESQGPSSKHLRKNFEHLGYHRLLSLEKLGSGVAQDCLVWMGTLDHPLWTLVCCATDLGLPRHSMSNLLMPVGVPSKAWHHRRLVGKTSKSKQWWPCEVNNESGGKPVIERFGLMLDWPHLLIH